MEKIFEENAGLIVFSIAIAILCSVLIPIFMKSEASVKLSATRVSNLINGERGPFGLGLLSKAREKVMAKLLSLYLSRMYNTEIASWEDGIPTSNSAVAHASNKHEDQNTMNIAMPDLSAEYWCTFVPAGQSPVITIKFPRWSRYTDLTAYDSTGLPISNINVRQIDNDERVSKLENSSDQIERSNVSGGGEFVTVNLMYNIPDWSGALIILFRVYRPLHIDICPHDELPQFRFIPKKFISAEQKKLKRQSGELHTVSSYFKLEKHDSTGYMPDDMFDTDSEDEYENWNTQQSMTRKKALSDSKPTSLDKEQQQQQQISTSSDFVEGSFSSVHIRQAPRDSAFKAGKRIGKAFSAVISRKIKKLDSEKLGTQWFFPKNVSGLFVNQSASYVVAFLPKYLPSNTTRSSQNTKKASMTSSGAVHRCKVDKPNVASSTVSSKSSNNNAALPLDSDNANALSEHSSDEEDMSHASSNDSSEEDTDNEVETSDDSDHDLNAIAHGMKVCGKVPDQKVWRPFFGFMAISYKTTETISSMTDEEFDKVNKDINAKSGWGLSFTLFVSHSKEEAIKYGGYEEDNEEHHLLVWNKCNMPGLVMRYLHYYEESSQLTPLEAQEAKLERKNLAKLDGTMEKLNSCEVPGVARIDYF